MRAFFLIILILPLVGCAHRDKTYVGYVRDVRLLEEMCQLLQEEIALLKRSLSQQETENNPARLGDLARQRHEAAIRARSAYSHDQRVRDLQDMYRILTRQAEALGAEFHAYHDGKTIDIFE